MMDCRECRERILDHLYGLLDEPQDQALVAHLQQCAGCRAVRRQAEQWQQLLRQAARGRFPHVRFEPPRLAEPAQPLPPTLPASAAARWADRLAWLAAAVIWLALPVVAFSHHQHRRQLADAYHQLTETHRQWEELKNRYARGRQEAEQPLVQARRRLAEAEQLTAGLLRKWIEQLQAAERQESGGVAVIAPATLQPGAANELLVVVHDRQPRTDRRLLAEIRDDTDAVLFSHPLPGETEQRRPHRLHLPARLWTQVRPDSQLYLAVVAVDERTGHRQPLQDKIRLMGPVYVTHLTTDKSTYRPGEVLRFRSLTLDRVSFQPPPQEQILTYTVKNVRGQPLPGLYVRGTTALVRAGEQGLSPLLGPDGQPLRGVGCGEILLPPDLPEGDYFLEMYESPHPSGRPPYQLFPVRRMFQVRHGPADRYAKQLDFLEAAAFAPGQEVVAVATLRHQNQPAQDIGVDIHAVADGQPIQAFHTTPHRRTDSQGTVHIRFRLPPVLPRGDVRLEVLFHTPTGTERISRAVPVVGRQVIVEFFPEGGTFVAGMPCQVYVRATTPAGVPVDVRGHITDGRQIVATVQTLTDPRLAAANRGLGVFTVTPELGRPLWLQLTEPQQVNAPLLPAAWKPATTALASLTGAAAALDRCRGYPLPEPQADGVLLSVPQPVVAAGQPLTVKVCSAARPRNLVVGAYIRGRLADMQRVAAPPGQPLTLRLLTQERSRGGVTRITVFEEPNDPTADLRPCAERLAFRHPGEHLSFETRWRNAAPADTPPSPAPDHPAPPAGTPGQILQLDILARDEQQQPTPAVLYAAVVNSAVTPGPRDRFLTTHFLLGGEVSTADSLEYADFLLSDHPLAPTLLDLTLATQGWRRFIEQNPTLPAKGGLPPQTPTAIDRLLLRAVSGQFPLPLLPASDQQRLRLYEQFWPRYEHAARDLQTARAALEAAKTQYEARQTAFESLRRQADEQSAALAERRQHLQQAARHYDLWVRWRPTGLILSGVAAVGCLLAAVRRRSARLSWGLSSAGAVALLLLLAVVIDPGVAGGAIPMLDPTPDLSPATAQPTASPKQDATSTTAATGAPSANGPPATASPADPSASGNRRWKNPGQSLSGDAKKHGTQFRETSPITATGDRVADKATPAPAMPKVQYNQYKLPPPTVLPKSPLGSLLPPLLRNDGRPSGWKEIPVERLQEPLNNPRQLAVLDSRGLTTAPVTGHADAGTEPMKGREGLSGTSMQGRSGSFKTAAMESAQSRELTQKMQELQQQLREQAEKFAQQESSRRSEELERGRQLLAVRHSSNDPGPSDRQGPDELDAIYRQLAGIVAISLPPLIVREYAPPRPGSSGAATETDTILWQPVIVLPGEGDQRGRCRLSFTVGSAPEYELVLAGHTPEGRLGAIRQRIVVATPQLTPAAPAMSAGPQAPPASDLRPAPAAPGAVVPPNESNAPNKPIPAEAPPPSELPPRR